MSDITEADRNNYIARSLATVLTEAMIAVRQPPERPVQATVTDHDGRPTVTLVLACGDATTVEHVVRLSKRILHNVDAMNIDMEQDWRGA
jgi:hypothetical protein